MMIPEDIEQEICDHLDRMDPKTKSVVQPFMGQHSEDTWIRDVLLAYWWYFLLVLKYDESHSKAEDVLFRQLRDLVPEQFRMNLDMVEEALSEQFQSKGYYFLGGYTLPYRGPYIWKRIERQEFDVELSDQMRKVTVFFMHDFLMRSWLHFETYGASGTGGWVKRDQPPYEDGLYCVADCYDLKRLEDDEGFQISLLKHEAQHFADLTNFPELNSTDLEYRAKLVELIYYTSVEDCLVRIIREAVNDSSNPHEYAAHLILKGLSEQVFDEPLVHDESRWQIIDYSVIREDARQMLDENTRSMRTNTENRSSLPVT
jgi:hypothetical protein